MIEDAKRMSCGACGHQVFTIYQIGKEYDDLELVAECLKCKSTSVITASSSQVRIDFGEGSEGRLCLL